MWYLVICANLNAFGCSYVSESKYPDFNTCNLAVASMKLPDKANNVVYCKYK